MPTGEWPTHQSKAWCGINSTPKKCFRILTGQAGRPVPYRTLFWYRARYNIIYAAVVKLVYTLASGVSERKLVGVRVSPAAPIEYD